jgi:O-antigen ligase
LLVSGLVLTLTAYWLAGIAGPILIVGGLMLARPPLTWRPPAVSFWPLAAFLAAATLATAYSVDRERSTVAMCWLMALTAAAILANTLPAGDRPAVLGAGMIASLVLVLINCLPWLEEGAPLAWRVKWEHNNGIALLNMLALAALSAGFFKSRLWWLWLIPFGWLTWFSASRSGAIGLAAGLAVYLAARHVKDRNILALAGMTLPGLALLAAALDRGLLNLSSRLDYWRIALQMWIARPWLGAGPDTYQSFYVAAFPDTPRFSHAHSLPLNTLAESGLIGLAALAWFVASLALDLWRRRADPFALAALSAGASLLAHSLVDTPTTTAYVAGAMAILIGLALRPTSTTDESGDAHVGTA